MSKNVKIYAVRNCTVPDKGLIERFDSVVVTEEELEAKELPFLKHFSLEEGGKPIKMPKVATTKKQIQKAADEEAKDKEIAALKEQLLAASGSGDESEEMKALKKELATTKGQLTKAQKAAEKDI